ncbi:hypothetical protein [Maridesulfovibrio bastinii]|uniref:hypothetical protein n=1 Tax=Maridesulfovibrio bastinii TaxID=47157 RepID=UPI00041A773C|nr:hypothetical protein [Maridesulfovibrio bastinii]
MEEKNTITLFVNKKFSKIMASTFTKGVTIPLYTGKSIEDILKNQIGIPESDVNNRIKTVFIDGHPVDDISNIIVSPFSTLSLAAAMPGIAGICMGRNSPVAAFRSDISAATDNNNHKAEYSNITLKLFNTTIDIAGEYVLKHGLIFSPSELKNLLEEKMKLYLNEEIKVEFQGQAISIEALLSILNELDEDVLFKKFDLN